MESDWQEVTRIPAVPPSQVAGYTTSSPALAFDTQQELLWVGSEQGRVTSYYSPELRKYTSYRGHDHATAPADDEVRGIQVNDRGVISLAGKSMHFSIRRGLAQWNIRDKRFRNLSTMAYTNRGNSEILVAGAQNSMFTVNVDRGNVLGEYPTDDDIKVMKRSSRTIVYGTAAGDVKLLDMNSFKVVQNFPQAHSSAISDIDTQANTLLTCGYSPRQGTYHLDTLVKVYDLRMHRALPPIGFPSGAAFVRMHPKLTAAAIVASQAGQIQVIDIMNPAAMKLYHANVTSYITAMELAPSGDALALMDADGFLQLWGSPEKLRFTELMNPVEWPEPPAIPTVTINGDTPLNTIGMPYYRDVLLSAWPAHTIFEVNKMPQKIDADILAASATKTGYAPYHRRTPRYCVEKVKPTDVPGVVPAPKFLSQQAKDKNSRNPGDFDDGKLLYDETRRQFEVPPVFRKVEIKYSKFGVDDFDFEFYNKTKFSGLETHISNSYMNPLLQMYKFTPILRNLALDHTATACAKEDCMLCQMGFLFDMLDKANGQNCQATNFLKTFSSLPTAARHGVLEEDSSSNGPLTAMIQSLNRFLLDQISLDQRNWQPASRALEEAITIGATKSQRCNTCGKESRPLGDTNVTDLIYPQKQNKPIQSFSVLVKQSIQLDTSQRGWCDKCRRYQQQAMRKTVKRLPKVLMFNATTNEKSHSYIREHWLSPGWMPDEIGVLVENGQLSVYQGEELADMKEANGLVLYDLVGFVAEIRVEEERNIHLISFVNVALSSPERSGKSNWHMFNDFLVRPVKREDALDFAPKWKMPSVLCFQAQGPKNVVDNSWRNRLDTSLLYSNYSYGYASLQSSMWMGGHGVGLTGSYGDRELQREPRCKPLGPAEQPKPGTLVALDAEFVSMQNEEIEVKADGSRSVVRPSRLGLARVSVLRGEGVDGGVPFLDDYIITKEPVVDFLTEFSGIHAGDLDPATSRHALVPLKVAYKRLWLLLNLGCVFVGHGLLKDFRIINIHVPKEQVVDTVDIFVLKSSQRKLSLRFLAWVILREEIQLDTHDSIEDSLTALRLYKKYLEYNDAGVLDAILNSIQAEGMRTGFKPPPRGLPMDQQRTETPPIVREGRSEANTPQPRGGVLKWPGGF